MSQLIGKTLDDKYCIDQQLGQGGMGSIYLATHTGTLRPVALKVIAPHFMSHPEFLERFRREAEAAGRLRHPNVVNVTDFGFTKIDSQNIAYLVMEYLEGCSLADILTEEGKIPLSWTVDILEQVCDAMEEAHNQGIVHRDLKPDNIWLEPDRRGGYTVKVLDFGLAKIAESQPTNQIACRIEPPTSIPTAEIDPRKTLPNRNPYDSFSEAKTNIQAGVHNSIPEAETAVMNREGKIGSGERSPDSELQNSSAGSNLTKVGTILGTPLYMSPEQCRGDRLDAKSDIYSLGVIAYQMLSGETPFKGNSFSLLAQHIEAVPPALQKVAPKINKPIAELIMKALSKNPADRPPSASSFASALRARSESAFSLMRQAISLYSDHFPTFIKISLIANSLLIVVSMLFSLPLQLKTHISLDGEDSVTASQIGMVVVAIFVGLLQLFSGLVAKAVNDAAVVPVVAQLMLTPLRPVSIRTIFEKLRPRAKALITTSLRYYGYCYLLLPLFIPAIFVYFRNSLYAPVFIMEGKASKQAMKRSKELFKRLPRVIIPLLILSLFISFSLMDNMARFFYLIMSLFFTPIMSIAFALTYFRTRQANGETIAEVLGTQFQDSATPKSRWQQKMQQSSRLRTPSQKT
ncbi:MAG: serine/threonine protein kinase, partial [Blastocatellia bacterium]|nr:serine/threonine protein kinase [Blastocatellia bacterium]